MKSYRILLYLGGLALIAACGYMLYDKFSNPSVFWLDMVILMWVYSINIWSAKDLFLSSDRFAKQVASIGVLLTVQFTYTLFALIGIVAGYLLELEMGWQFIYQAAFLLLFALGIYIAAVAGQRHEQVVMAEEQNERGLSALKSQAEMLRYRAGTSALSSEEKQQIARLAERIGMLSPNTSALAVSLEGELCAGLEELLRLLSGSRIESNAIGQKLSVCEQQVAERMKIVTK